MSTRSIKKGNPNPISLSSSRRLILLLSPFCQGEFVQAEVSKTNVPLDLDGEETHGVGLT